MIWLKTVFNKYIWLAFAAVAIFSCSDSSSPDERKWTLVWQDEFDGVAGQLVDTTKWGYDIGLDWGNAQLEYTTDRSENVSIDGQGNLAIIARKESYLGRNYTAARISTRGLFEQTYGRFEARIQLPWGQGIWPAFWLLGADCIPANFPNGTCCIGTSNWPDCGEIDIMEYRGQEPTRVDGTLHGPGYSGGGGITQRFDLNNDRFDTGFHIFKVEWGVDFIDWFVDDKLYHRVEPKDLPGDWVFDQPFYIIFNLAVGGGFVGSPNETTIFPQTMLIDWIRVYEQE